MPHWTLAERVTPSHVEKRPPKGKIVLLNCSILRDTGMLRHILTIPTKQHTHIYTLREEHKNGQKKITSTLRAGREKSILFNSQGGFLSSRQFSAILIKWKHTDTYLHIHTHTHKGSESMLRRGRKLSLGAQAQARTLPSGGWTWSLWIRFSSPLACSTRPIPSSTPVLGDDLAPFAHHQTCFAPTHTYTNRFRFETECGVLKAFFL